MLLSAQKHWLVLIALISLLGFGLRFYRLSSQSFWPDEISSVLIARAPLTRIFERSAQDNCLPPYFLLLRTMVGRYLRNPIYVALTMRETRAIAGE